LPEKDLCGFIERFYRSKSLNYTIMFLEVTQAKYFDGCRILSAFNDGVTKIVDFLMN